MEDCAKSIKSEPKAVDESSILYAAPANGEISKYSEAKTQFSISTIFVDINAIIRIAVMSASFCATIVLTLADK